MPITYEPIATTTLGSAAASVTFSAIPATYTDLRLVVTGGTSVSGTYAWIQYNSDTASNYSTTRLDGDGSGAASARTTNATFIRNSTSLDSNPNLIITDIFSYAGSTFKTCLIETAADQNGSGRVTRTVGLWRSTSAITSILFSANSGNLNAGTTATLYGIKNA
jgi:hypothetical protein